MVNVKLCDCIKCIPDITDEICLRCVDEQYEYLIHTIEASDDGETWLYDDEEYVESWFDFD